MRDLYTGVITPWPFHAEVVRTDANTQVDLHMFFKKHHTHFRGFCALHPDLNRQVFHALTVRASVVLCLDASGYPWKPHVWTLVKVRCSDMDAPVHQAVCAAVERENLAIQKGWSPVWCATGNSIGAHVQMLARLKQDVGATLCM